MEKTKVYAVIGSTDFEGCAEPAGIFTSFEKAVIARDACAKRYHAVEIYEYDLDADVGSSGFLC
jgi:hypothetical protein